MFKGLGGLGDMGKMMKAAQEMQGKMAQMQEEMVNIMVEGQAGAGMVKATCSAKGDLKACLLYTSPSPRDKRQSRMPSSA